jgi:hypothetical protein
VVIGQTLVKELTLVIELSRSQDYVNVQLINLEPELTITFAQEIILKFIKLKQLVKSLNREVKPA